MDVKPVDLLLVSYVDADGFEITQFAIAGKNNVKLLNNRTLGFNGPATPSGSASKWLNDAVIEALKEAEVEDVKTTRKKSL